MPADLDDLPDLESRITVTPMHIDTRGNTQTTPPADALRRVHAGEPAQGQPVCITKSRCWLRATKPA
jgi:hypothetical protein